MEKTEASDRIDGRRVTSGTIKGMTNCRLKLTRDRLSDMLAMVEEEMERRMGQGNGGLA